MKIAIITAEGLGDGLQMMIAAHHLKKEGHDIIVYNRHLSEFEDCFKGFEFKYPFNLEDINSYDSILLEHDNSQKSVQIADYLKKIPIGKVLFIMNYSAKKHGSVDSSMYCFDKKKTMLENIILGTKFMFSIENVTSDNGITIPSYLKHRKNRKVIIIHPTASHFDKTWDKKKFVKLAILLRQKGYKCSFVMTADERPEWLFLKKLGFEVPLINNLCDLTWIIYEAYAFIGNDSGPAHLASCLKLPVIVIGKRLQNLKYWKPDWYKSKIVSPYKFIPNFKFMRLREKIWKKWITPKAVFSKFDELIKN